MTDTHTPGPWRVSGCHLEQPRSENIHLLVEHGDESTSAPLIAEVYMDSDRLPTAANAKLIAAAPDLLEALEKLADWPRQSTTVDGDLSADPRVGLANVRRFARATIEAAKGEK